MKEIYIIDDFIKLGQALKLSGLSQNGADAKLSVQDGLVKVNGETETRRGRKLVENDVVSYKGSSFTVKKKKHL